ncbi:MAG: hypothetical protein HY984_01405 [Candidatus Magasanikbacteria bacterium]|nr:hypothetical protein [Candidatus Magasanikbacteria bacterium]
MLRSKFFILSGLLAIVGLIGIFHAAPALAAPEDEDLLGVRYGKDSGLSDADVRSTVPKIINTILGLLGTVAVCLVIYAGFTWMFSGGNEEKATKARQILWAAVIGLVVIMSAYSISVFVLRGICQSTRSYDAYLGCPE